MNMIEQTKKYLLSQFGASFFIFDRIEDNKIPMQVRKSMDVFNGQINELFFYIVKLHDERIFASNGQIAINRLQDALHGKPIIFIAEYLKPTNIAWLRNNKLGYIVPRSHCYIPPMLLQDSAPKILNSKLSIFATTIIMQYLESQLSSQFFASDLNLYGSKMSKSRAISELEDHKIIETYKYGRTQEITFLKTKLELWADRKSLSPICQKIITVQKHLVNLDDQIFCGETALSMYSLLTPPKRPCIAMKKWEYDDEDDYYHAEKFSTNNSQLIDIHIYPMDLQADKIHEKRYITPIALLLSGLKPSDERAYLSLEELEKKITEKLEMESYSYKLGV